MAGERSTRPTGFDCQVNIRQRRVRAHTDSFGGSLRGESVTPITTVRRQPAGCTPSGQVALRSDGSGLERAYLPWRQRAHARPAPARLAPHRSRGAAKRRTCPHARPPRR
eukprot:6035447-Prymnesium_polylepis.1